MSLYAAIDMGSGAMRVIYARIDAQGVPVVVHRKGYRYFLADEVKRGVFSELRMAEVVNACVEAMADIRASGATFVGATATEVFRAASNGMQLIERVREKAGLPMRIITGEDELRMSYQGAVPYIHRNYDSIIFADSGGASTEVAHINHKAGDVHGWVSLKMGLMTHLHEMGHEDITTPERFNAIKDLFKEIIVSGCKENGIEPSKQALVIAGAPMFLTAYMNDVADRNRNDYQAPGEDVSYAAMLALAEKMCAMGKTGRSQDPLIGKNPFESFVPATAKCLALMEVFGADSFQAVPSGIALTLVLEHLQQSESA